MMVNVAHHWKMVMNIASDEWHMSSSDAAKLLDP